MSFGKQLNGYGPDGRRTLHKGGGGSSGTYYANQDKLLGVQADIAEGMYNNIYQPNAPAAVGRLGAMTSDAATGVLSEQARSRAGADAEMSLGQGLASAQRGMDRYGTTMNPNMLAANMQDAAVQGAATKSGAMNKANEWGEGQKWARNYDFYNALSGVPSQATSSLGSAAAGYGSMGRNEDNTSMANAQGYGQFGGSMANALMRADGGPVHRDHARRPKKRKSDLHLASGGLAPLQPWRTRASNVQQQNAPGAIESVAMGAAPMVAAEGVKGGIGALKSALASTPTAAPVADAIPVLTEAGAAANGAGIGESLAAAHQTGAAAEGIAGISAVGDTAALGAAAAETGAAAGAAGAGAGAGAMTALGTAMPWVGAGLLAAQAFGLFDADGGEISKDDPRLGGRQDFKPGGPVSGPGTETSDSIPAWLSDKEFVLNAEAVEMVGTKKLNKINDAGLKKRASLGDAKRGEDGAEALAGGGMLGVSLGAATQQWNQQEQMRREEKRLSMEEQRLADSLKSSAQERDMRDTDSAVKQLSLAEAKRNAAQNAIIDSASSQTTAPQAPKPQFGPTREGEVLPDVAQPDRALAPEEIRANVVQKLQGAGYGRAASAYQRGERQASLGDAQTGLQERVVGKAALADAVHTLNNGSTSQAVGVLNDPTVQRMVPALAGRSITDVTPTATGLAVTDSRGVTTQHTKKEMAGVAGLLDPQFYTLKEGEQRYVTTPGATTPGFLINENVKDFKTPAEARAHTETLRNQAIAVGTRFLDANKTMMAQFGGDEQAVRQEMTLNHSRKIGEFEARSGRPPNLAESEAMARQSLAEAQKTLATSKVSPPAGAAPGNVQPSLWKKK